MGNKGGAKYDQDGKLLTVRKPSKDPAVRVPFTMPESQAALLHQYCKENGVVKSRLIARLVREFLEGH